MSNRWRRLVLRHLKRDANARGAIFEIAQRVAAAADKEYGISTDTLLFGGRGKLPREKVILLLAVVKAFHEAADARRDSIALSAVLYCQSMAILLLAGTEANNETDETEFI